MREALGSRPFFCPGRSCAKSNNDMPNFILLAPRWLLSGLFCTWLLGISRSAVADDTTPPTLLSSTMSNGVVTFSFSEPMDTRWRSFAWNANRYVSSNSFSGYRWSADQRALSFDAALSSGTTITFILNPSGYSSQFRDSVGNFLAADTYSSQLSVPSAPDVWYFSVGKAQIFQQTGSEAPSLAATNPYASIALLRSTAAGNVTNATFQTPGGITKTLINSPDPQSFRLQESFATQSALDAVYGTGTYTATARTTHDGIRSLPLDLAAGPYPAAPQFANASQTINPSNSFRLRWALPGGTAADYVQVDVMNASGNSVFTTPGFMMAEALDGMATFVDIPANTLVSSNAYTATILLARGVPTNFASYAGVTGYACYASQTRCSIGTFPAPIAPTITEQPQSRTNIVGTAASFSVIASGTTPIHYQWWLGNSPLGGATNATYAIASVQTNHAGNYRVVISNSMGAVTSAVASLTIVVPLVAELLWQVQVPGQIRAAPAIGKDGTIYVGSWDGNLYAFNPNSSRRWTFPGGNWFHAAPAIGADGTIYAANLDHKLYALNPDGTKRWEFLTAGEMYTSPAVAADGTIYVGANGSRLYAINPIGTEKWSVAVDADGVACPAVGTDGTIYFTTGKASRSEGKLFAFSPHGTKRWEFTASNISASPALAADGTIYFSTVWQPTPRLFAITPAGTKKWELPLEGLMDWTGTSPIIGQDGTIYIGSNSNKLFAVNPDGSKKWEFVTGGNIYASAAAGADGVIYVGSWDRHFYAINPNGTLRWSFESDYDIASSPALASEGVVYVGGHNESGGGALFAFRASSGPAQSSWPMLMRTAQRTGSVQQILAAERLDAGCALRLEGVVGRTYGIEYLDVLAATNAWQSLTNLVLPTSPFLFPIVENPSGSQRYFRTTLLP